MATVEDLIEKNRASLTKLVEEARTLPEADRNEFAKEIANAVGLQPPSAGVTDQIWRRVVTAFVFALVVSVSLLAIGMFVKASGAVSGDLMLAVFTSATGFLSGLLVPTPRQ